MQLALLLVKARIFHVTYGREPQFTSNPCHFLPFSLNFLSMNRTMNISLPESLRLYVNEQVERRGYGSSSEYMRELIRRDRSREAMRALILEGLESPIGGPADEAFFASLQKRAGDDSAK